MDTNNNNNNFPIIGGICVPPHDIFTSATRSIVKLTFRPNFSFQSVENNKPASFSRKEKFSVKVKR